MSEEISEVKNVVECPELKPKRRGRPPYKHLKEVNEEQNRLIFENSPLSKPIKDHKFVSGINNLEKVLYSKEVKDREVICEDLFKEFIKSFKLTYIPNKYACINFKDFIDFCNKYGLEYDGSFNNI